MKKKISLIIDIIIKLVKKKEKMKTVIREITWLNRDTIREFGFTMDFGWGNGYVIIPQDHGMYGKHYDFINNYVDVHCGLTYSELIDERIRESFKLEKEDLNKWIVGFDTCHCDDTLLRWPKEEVQRETDRLVNQLDLLWNERFDEEPDYDSEE